MDLVRSFYPVSALRAAVMNSCSLRGGSRSSCLCSGIRPNSSSGPTAPPGWSGFSPVSLFSAWQRRCEQRRWTLGCHSDSRREGGSKEPPNPVYRQGSCLSPLLRATYFRPCCRTKKSHLGLGGAGRTRWREPAVLGTVAGAYSCTV